MIDVALNFLKKYIDKKFQGTIGAPDVIVSDVPKDISEIDGDRIYVTLINIEEEKVLKNLPTYQNSPNGSIQLMNPEIRLNLYVLVSAIFKKDIISFFLISGIILNSSDSIFLITINHPWWGGKN